MNNKSIIVKRIGKNDNDDLKEIKKLANSGGYKVCGVVTQKRKEDSEYNIGSGKVKTVYNITSKNNSRTVIFDNKLSPRQKYNLELFMPEEVRVIDKQILILEIFERRASTRKAQLEVELARLRYELPRISVKKHLSKKKEKPGFMGLGEYNNNKEKDIKNRIRRIEKELDKVEENKEKRRERRAQNGYNLISIAGFTNSGKSTLLRLLSKNIEKQKTIEDKHSDLNSKAKTNDEMFTTLQTTVWKGNFKTQDILVSDTIGFISDIPDWIISSFRATLDTVYNSNLVLLVLDITKDIEKIKEEINYYNNLRTENPRTLIVFNKIDKLSKEELNKKKKILNNNYEKTEFISAKNNENIDKLKQKIIKEIPDIKTETLQIRQKEETMTLISKIYNNSLVEKIQYVEDKVIIKFKAREQFINKIKQKMKKLPNS